MLPPKLSPTSTYLHTSDIIPWNLCFKSLVIRKSANSLMKWSGSFSKSIDNNLWMSKELSCIWELTDDKILKGTNEFFEVLKENYLPDTLCPFHNFCDITRSVPPYWMSRMLIMLEGSLHDFKSRSTLSLAHPVMWSFNRIKFSSLDIWNLTVEVYWRRK